MYELRFENEKGETITLTGVEDKYQITNIEGLNPPEATIYRSEMPGKDGSKHMSSKLTERNIVLTIRINGKVEENRLNLYNYFKSKHYAKMYYSNASREVYAEGYVESVAVGLFDISENMQISIICSDPYFYSMKEIVSDISQVIGAFEFPFAFGADGMGDPTITDDAIEFSIYKKDALMVVVNEGEDETGMVIRLNFTGTVVNPTIYDTVTRDAFALRYIFYEGDEVTINTNPGEKRVTLLRDGDTINLINKLDRNSTWLTLEKGDNIFAYEAESGTSDMLAVFTHRSKYQGV